MNKRILDNLTPREAMTSRFCDMLGHCVDLRVRKEIKAKGDMTTEEARTEAIEMYQSIVHSATASTSDRLKSRTRLDVLQGLEAEAASGVTGEALLAVLANAQATLGAGVIAPPAKDVQKQPIAAEDASARPSAASQVPAKDASP